MGWFDEQIKQRKHADDTVLDEAFIGMADAILGTNSTSFFSVSGTESVGAIEEILRFYKIRPAEVPDSVKTFGDRLEFLLQPNGIMTRSIRLEEGWYRDAVGAILVERTDDGTAAALIPRGVGGYVFYDPQKRKYVRLNRKNEHLFSRDAISFYKPFPLKKLSVGSLMRYIAEMIEPSDLVLVSAASLAVTLVGMLLPRVSNFLFGTVAAHQSIQLLIGIAVFMISISVGSLLLQTVQGMLTERITVKMNLSIHAATMMRVLSLPPSFFKQYSAGEITSRAGRMNSLCTLLVSTVLGTSLTSLFSLVYLTQIAEFAPALAVPAVTVMVVTLVFSIITTLLQMHITQKQMEIAAKESGMTYAMLTGIQKIKLAGAEKRAFARWSRLFSAHLALTYHPPLFLRVNATIGMIISLVGTLWMYTAALASEVSVADYYAFNSAYGMLSGAFMSLAGIATTAAQIRPILEMARPLMETEPEIAESKPVTERISGGIELNNVTFRYTESMPPVLNDLSLKIRAGQYIAIVGPTGCGKSTLLRILLGFEVPQGGAVYYDGRDLAAMDKKSLRRKIGVVLQNGKLFQGIFTPTL